jgi:hypothetical protein
MEVLSWTWLLPSTVPVCTIGNGRWQWWRHDIVSFLEELSRLPVEFPKLLYSYGWFFSACAFGCNVSHGWCLLDDAFLRFGQAWPSDCRLLYSTWVEGTLVQAVPGSLTFYTGAWYWSPRSPDASYLSYCIEAEYSDFVVCRRSVIGIGAIPEIRVVSATWPFSMNYDKQLHGVF